MNVGGIQSDFGCHQGWTASLISFFSWWNKENRVLIFPIPSSIDSSQKLSKNEDGSINVYFGPKAPEGKESNWLPTAEEKRFFLIFRFYGPQKGVFDGSFELNDVELIE